jgi:hypothetical protein
VGCARAAATHSDAGLAKLLAHRGPGNAQLGTDLAQGPALGVQVGCTLSVHHATVAAAVYKNALYVPSVVASLSRRYGGNGGLPES